MDNFTDVFISFVDNLSHTTIAVYTFTLIFCLSLFALVFKLIKGRVTL